MKDHSAHLWAVGCKSASGRKHTQTTAYKRFSERIHDYPPGLFKRRTYKPDHISDFNLNGYTQLNQEPWCEFSETSSPEEDTGFSGSGHFTDFEGMEEVFLDI